MKEVSVDNVPSLLYAKDVELSLPDVGTAVVDVVFGGKFFALIPAQSPGLETTANNAPRLTHRGRRMDRNSTVPACMPGAIVSGPRRLLVQ